MGAASRCFPAIPSLRPTAARAHRYVGVLLAVFLFMSGITGSILVFHEELDSWLNPEWFRAKATGTPLPLSDVVAAVEMRYPGAYVSRITLPQEQRAALRLWLEPKPLPDGPAEIDVDRVYVDPANGEILGARKWDALQWDRAHLVPFIYELHRRLHSGRWGEWLLGAVALLWIFDCFIALGLAWPRPTRAAVKRALSIKRGAGASRLHYDAHRAGGLWFWPLLLTLAVSGVYFNLNREVFQPALSLFTAVTPLPGSALSRRPDPTASIDVDWDEAIARATTALAGGSAPARWGDIRYGQSSGLYSVGFHTAVDISTHYPGTRIYVAGDTGRVLTVRKPGTGTIGDTVVQWQFPLHSGQAFGFPGRILIFLAGVVVATLSITGIVIWRRKCAASRIARWADGAIRQQGRRL